jgi:hypothetical protein
MDEIHVKKWDNSIRMPKSSNTRVGVIPIIYDKSEKEN